MVEWQQQLVPAQGVAEVRQGKEREGDDMGIGAEGHGEMICSGS